MKITRAYKTELRPNKAQIENLKKHIDGARFIFNWALATRKAVYENEGKTLNAFALNKLLTELKQNDECQWLYDVSNKALQSAIQDVCRAFDNFFRRVKNGEVPGYPRFKSRRNPKASFRLYGTIKVSNNAVQLPKLGIIKLKEKDYLPTGDIKILNATVSTVAGRWYVSLQVEQDIPEVTAAGPAIGVDLGIKRLATCSDGFTVDNPKALSKLERKLARLQREYSRREKGSNNQDKTRVKIAKLHKRIADTRGTAIHQATHSIIANRPSQIVVEDLNVSGMLKNHKMAKAVSDASMSEFRRQLEYKSAWNSVEVIKANRFYPSSKTCSYCGHVKEKLSLSERTFKCEVCGYVIDRDLNAAINLAALAGKSPDSINACREESAGGSACADRETVLCEAGTCVY